MKKPKIKVYKSYDKWLVDCPCCNWRMNTEYATTVEATAETPNLVLTVSAKLLLPRAFAGEPMVGAQKAVDKAMEFLQAELEKL
jgi:hypothetical protein